MTYRLVSAASRELSEAAHYYDNQMPGLGDRFVTEVEKAISRILAAPEAWRPMSPRTRRCLVHRFPFGVVYQIRKEEILILAVQDLRRDPKLWNSLL